MYIPRLLSDTILNRLNLFPAVAILGARQVGKTTLAKSLQKHFKRDSIYLDMELESDLNRLEHAELFFEQNQDRCIILDEVQRKPDLFPILRGVIDKNRKPGRFVLLGSANPHILKLSSETLAGRIAYLELTGLNVLEAAPTIDQNTLWLKGGFPEPLLAQDDHFQKLWFESFVKTFVERDIPLLGLSLSPQLIRRCLRMVAHSTGQVLNKSLFSKSLDIRNAVVSTIIDYFENTYIIRQLLPYFTNIKKRLVKSPKLYIRDSGLLHYLLDIPDMNSILGHPALGHSWEAFVIEQIISVFDGAFDYYYYRTQDGAECDLVLTKADRPFVCVEVKFTSTPKSSKSLTTAIRDIGTENNFVIIPTCSEPYPVNPGLTATNLVHFIEMIKKLR